MHAAGWMLLNAHQLEPAVPELTVGLDVLAVLRGPALLIVQAVLSWLYFCVVVLTGLS